MNIKSIGLLWGLLAGSVSLTFFCTASRASEYFVSATAGVVLNDIPSNYDYVSPVAGVATGQIDGPVATITNPVTSLYYDSSVGYNTVSGTLISQGNATATADRENGTVHAAGGPTYMSSGAGTVGFPGTGTASFGDTLHFTNAGASSTTITTVGFSVHLDGLLGGFLPGFCCTSSGNSRADLLLTVGNQVYSGGNVGGYNPTTDNIVRTGSISQNFYGGGPETIDQTYTGSFSFSGANADAAIYMFLDAGGQYEYSNFGDTAQFSFNALPNGVSFTSASGDFLAGDVPEPSTWAMMFLGFFGIGAMTYRRRKSAMATG